MPIELMQEWDQLDPDLAAAIVIEPTRIIDHDRYEVRARRAFDPSHFSKRELNLLQVIAQQHRDALSRNMVDVTHAESGAWEKTWADGAGNDRVIRYTLAVSESDPHRDALLTAAEEHEGIRAAQGR